MNQHIMADADCEPEAENVVVYLGDYIDRGLDVYRTLALLVKGLPEPFQVVCLRGNHEELLLRFLEDSNHLESWLAAGGRTTLMNYKVAVPGEGAAITRPADLQDAFYHALPEQHRHFLGELQTSYALGDYLFVHAGVRPGIDLDKQCPQDLLWIREGFLASNENYGARVVHGHSIVSDPEIHANRIGVDTGAYATGVLSCAVLEDDQVRFLHATAWEKGGNCMVRGNR